MATNAPADDWERYVRELGVALQKARASGQLSQERVAAAAGISAFTLRKLESGESNPGSAANPRLRTLLALSNVLGVDVAELLPRWRPEVAPGR